ncbi:MAG: glycosyltransferase, partial [Bacteroidetes bacterium]|nr:glycosyltransferase [Bacteroidota bacterium]
MEQYHFVIIGESREQAYLQQLVAENNLTNVELTGYIPFEKAASYIMASKIGLCPFLRNLHHDTTYSNKMFQYMAYGKAVIASDCSAQANIVRKEECGLIFEAGNAADLAKQILKLNDKQLLDKYGKIGLDTVNRKYNTKVGHQELIRLYQSLNNNHFIEKHQPDAIQ